jgi:acetylornithine/succinyldiaminopimelate/putrescine aminotransferase
MKPVLSLSWTKSGRLWTYGTLWGFEQFDVVPDVLLLGKALGGGLPLGAFITSKERMDCLTDNPVLGHITTFGGHPLCCAAGKAAFEVLLEEGLYQSIQEKEGAAEKAAHSS